jgi:hypothetical protein
MRGGLILVAAAFVVSACGALPETATDELRRLNVGCALDVDVCFDLADRAGYGTPDYEFATERIREELG